MAQRAPFALGIGTFAPTQGHLLPKNARPLKSKKDQVVAFVAKRKLAKK